MLDSVDLLRTLKKKAYKPVRQEQIERIFDLSELIYEQKRPVIVVFEGWDAAGKGTTIRQLTAPLDARGFKVLATQAPRTHEKRKPWLWRFWMNIPRYGQIAIFDRSWYGRVLVERVNALTPMPQWIAAYEEINNFERTLADDGTVFIKLWLHISKDEQLRRFMQLASEPETAWQVTAEDWENHRKYEEYRAAVLDMLQKTDTPIAPWTVVPSNDGDVRQYTVFSTIIARLETALGLALTPWPSLDELSKKPAKDKHEKQEKKEKKAKNIDGIEEVKRVETPVETAASLSKDKAKKAVKKKEKHDKHKIAEKRGTPDDAQPVSPEAVAVEAEVSTSAESPRPAAKRKLASSKRAVAAVTNEEVDHA
ncbi:MAG: polyphosphate kinase 2 family protein [Caldilinea sp.]